MEKRLFMAVALSFLLILVWSSLQPKSPTAGLSQPTISPASSIIQEEKDQPQLKLSSFPVSLDIFEIIFTEPNAAIKEIIFNSYSHDRLVLKDAFLLGERDWTFKKDVISKERIRFSYQNKEKEIYKSFSFSNSNYSMELEIGVTNLSNAPLKLDLPVLLGTLNFQDDPSQAQYLDVAIGTSEKILHFNGRKNGDFGQAKFLALRNRYFCAIIEPTINSFGARVRKINNRESEIGLELKSLSINPNQTWKEKFRIYLGPQDLKQINQLNIGWANIIHYGAFDIISQILLSLLDFLQHIVRSWGWAIILLSTIIYFLLFPLTLKQMRSMKEMQTLQPRMEELKKLYKDNPQKLNKEVMQLYREHKVNPLGGCLPVVLQIPIFFALYQALARTIALKGAKFLWIKDLSQPDRLFTLPLNLPFLGNAVNILPILMAIGMFVQQKNTTLASPGVSGDQQKMMLVLFPVMFGVIFYNMPSGLVLYWFTNSIFTLLYQTRINKSKA